MFSSSIVWAVGGIAEVSSSGELRVLVEDVVELTFQALELRLGQSEAGEIGDVFDIGAGESGHRRMIAEARSAADPPLGRGMLREPCRSP